MTEHKRYLYNVHTCMIIRKGCQILKKFSQSIL
jgi:hypothetical protein